MVLVKHLFDGVERMAAYRSDVAVH